MKLLIVALALIATAYAALPSNEYLPPVEESAPEDLQTISETSPLADDGYRYRTVKRYRLRHRRDAPSSEYLPPVETAAPVVDIPVEAPAPVSFGGAESATLADDGYRYKTVKRIRYRHRRDVNELPSNEYLPPVQEAPVAVEAPAPAPVSFAGAESATLADDGYRYKTVKRIRYRHRRDVNELPSNEYLPPVQEAPVAVEAPAPAPVSFAGAESATLADDGYRYKTVKRIRYRHRRDVNELPSNEYLPPVQEAPVAVEAPAPAPVSFAGAESATLADDGYRYKTVKRIRYRHRRDVNELPSNEYLPPVQEAPVAVEAPAPAPVSFAGAESATLADDGYRYKTVKRIRYRHRRDVNELPSNEYLPPVQEAPVAVEAPAPAPVSFAGAESATLADDGYRYKTVKRIRYRHRRDVNELPSNEYLPPVQEAPVAVEAPAPAPVSFAGAESATLADDGYRYKTVKRIRYRHRRDVNELPSNEYLPPVQEAPVAVEAPAPAPVSFAGAESATLADDGYRYKTVKRIRYRHRRDVNELPSNEYLPPVQEAPVAVEAPAPAPVSFAGAESATLADDGYRYKTVKRIRYRHRRDVNELPSNEYLPPVQEAPVAVEAPAPAPVSFAGAESATLADDGYRYKTVRRIRYRHRRDVNELPSNEYLPPVQEAPVAVEAPAPAPVSFAGAESATLADDGYRYKTVKRIRYRHRRDVNELPSNEYLPPVQEAPVAVEAPAPAPVSFAGAESATLADDGYRYKTVKRVRYRHRRDVNELPSNEYLPPTEEAHVEVAPQETAVVADDGYRYKTVKRVVYRHRH